MSVTYARQISADDFSSAGMAAGAVKDILKQLGVASDTVRKAAIALYEGEMNMVIHAGGGRVDVSIDTDRITMTLVDSGPGIPDVEAAMREGFSTASDSVRELGFGAGMGLPNIKRYSDGMNILTSPKGTTLEIFINIA